MAKKYSTSLDVCDTAAEILAMNGVAGQHAFAIDTKTIYVHNGSVWITGYSLGKIIGSGNTPTATVGSFAGTGATATFGAGNTNLIGTLSIKLGTVVGTSGTLVTVTLADAASYPNTTVPLINPVNDDAIAFLKAYNTPPTTTGFTIQVKGITAAPVAGSVITFNYFNPGY